MFDFCRAFDLKLLYLLQADNIKVRSEKAMVEACHLLGPQRTTKRWPGFRQVAYVLDPPFGLSFIKSVAQAEQVQRYGPKGVSGILA